MNRNSGELWGHPKGVYVCFLTEMWERFSYYGMRALLMFYLTEHFLFTDDQGFAIYAAYTALAWALPVIGGVLADRYLGSRKAVTIGAILLSAGHLLMAWEGPSATLIVGSDEVKRSEFHFNMFLVSLALIVTGVGFLKTNISTIVGALYPKDDPRRDSGFTIFYLGINLGAFLGPLLCGLIGNQFGWGYGFSLAGLGMLAGLLMFLKWQKHLEGHADPPRAEILKEKMLGVVTREQVIWFAAIGIVILAWALIRYQLVGNALGWFGAIVGLTIIYYSIRHCSSEERNRLLVVGLLIAFSIGFWALYEQMGSSLNLFADRMVNRTIFGIEIPAQSLQSLPAFFVISLAPLATMLWTGLGRRSLNPGIPVKFALALLIIGSAYWLPVIGISLAGSDQQVGLIWFAALFFGMVCAELCMAPIGMNMITRLCPARIVGMMMGSFFLALSLGSFLAGRLATLASIDIVDGQVADTAEALSTYSRVFSWFAIGGSLLGLLLLVLSPFLYRHIREPKNQEYDIED